MDNLSEEQRQYVDGLLATEQAKVTALQAELDKLKQPEPTDKEKELQRLKAELLQVKTVSALQKMGAEDFAEFVSFSDETELEAKLAKLQEVLKNRTIDSSYKPDSHRQQHDPYSVAKHNGDHVGMLKSIFGLKN